MARSAEAKAHTRTFQERTFRQRGLFDVTSRPPDQIHALRGEHKDRKKELRAVHREIEAEKSKPKRQRDHEKLAQLTARYNDLSANQGAVRRALEMVDGKRF